MTKDEALTLALETLEFNQSVWRGKKEALTAIKEALAQPERPWVGLTDAEVFDLWLNETPAPARVFYQKLCRSVEAKLKEKNT